MTSKQTNKSISNITVTKTKQEAVVGSYLALVSEGLPEEGT